jgi:hypothetical protein
MRSRTAVAAATASLLIVPLTAVEAAAAPPVRFSRIQYDSPGTDTGTNKSLNAEWARVTNYGNKARVLTGWTIRDPQGHVYRFPKFRLKPGRSVRLHTGKGNNTARDLYWRQNWYVWNNTGDKALLKNKGKVTVDVCKWGNNGANSTTC